MKRMMTAKWKTDEDPSTVYERANAEAIFLKFSHVSILVLGILAVYCCRKSEDVGIDQ